MRNPCVVVPESNVTRISTLEGLTRMVLAWTDLDVPFLENYFNMGGKPYISFPNNLTHGKDCGFYYRLPNESIGMQYLDRYVVPLPSLMLKRYFLKEDGESDKEGLEAYNRMLDICVEHGLDMNAADSCGITMLNASMAVSSCFHELIYNGYTRRNDLSYDPSMYDYFTPTILINRGADPFYRADTSYCTAQLTQISAAAASSSSYITFGDSSPHILFPERYYNDLMYHISRDSPPSSTLLEGVQRTLIRDLIMCCFRFLKYEDDAEKTFLSLDSLLSKGIISPHALEYNAEEEMYRNGDSALGYLCRRVRGYIKYNTEMKEDCGVMFRRLVMLLQQYGADINRRERDGQTPVFGLLDSTSSISKDVYARLFYARLCEVEEALVHCGWDYTIPDDFGNTFFDKYPNKGEAKKALKIIKKLSEYEKISELAEAESQEIFLR